MAPKLPYSRTVNVTLSRTSSFATKRGFGVALLLTATAVAGILDATHRTKLYSSMEEVAVDHASNTQVYAGALAAFSQNPRPTQIKVGFITFTPGTSTAADLKTQLDAIYDADNQWYWVGIVAALRDLPALDGLIEWIQAKNKFALLDSNDILMQSLADTTNIAARNKNEVDRTAIFYHTDAAEYGGFALAASLGTFSFDEADSRYTAKYKKLQAVDPVNIGSAAVQIVTGFVPALGQSASAGHNANTYIDIGDQYFVAEGSTLTQNVFIDEVHATDWIIARTEEETLGILLNNASIPYTDAGMEMLASAARIVMRQATRAGLIAQDIDGDGNYSPAVEFIIPSVFDVPESQRKARIAPAIQVRFRYAGSVHYVTINYQMTF